MCVMRLELYLCTHSDSQRCSASQLIGMRNRPLRDNNDLAKADWVRIFQLLTIEFTSVSSPGRVVEFDKSMSNHD